LFICGYHDIAVICEEAKPDIFLYQWRSHISSIYKSICTEKGLFQWSICL